MAKIISFSTGREIAPDRIDDTQVCEAMDVDFEEDVSPEELQTIINRVFGTPTKVTPLSAKGANVASYWYSITQDGEYHEHKKGIYNHVFNDPSYPGA